jgi:alcohol oxidase
MGLFNQIPKGLDEVDVVIAGSGTADCIVTSRIAEADPNLSVLVVEGGKDNYNVESVVHPALFLENLAPTTITANFHKAKASKSLLGRESIVPTGGTLGGGSSINFMLLAN